MIRNIIFDMGNVLVRFDPNRFAAKATADPITQDLLVKEIFGSTDWIRFDGGLLSKGELKERVCQRLPKDTHEIADFLLKEWYQGMTAISETTALAEQLKNAGYPLYLLSNAPEDFYLFQENYPILARFDGLFISSDWRLLKPQKEIYTAFYSYFRLNPRECFFIDDSPANIFTGEETGMKGFVFNGDFGALEHELKTQGITY